MNYRSPKNDDFISMLWKNKVGFQVDHTISGWALCHATHHHLEALRDGSNNGGEFGFSLRPLKRVFLFHHAGMFYWGNVMGYLIPPWTLHGYINQLHHWYRRFAYGGRGFRIVLPFKLSLSGFSCIDDHRLGWLHWKENLFMQRINDLMPFNVYCLWSGVKRDSKYLQVLVCAFYEVCPQPSLLLHGLLLSIWCFSIFVNCYFQFS